MPSRSSSSADYAAEAAELPDQPDSPDLDRGEELNAVDGGKKTNVDNTAPSAQAPTLPLQETERLALSLIHLRRHRQNE